MGINLSFDKRSPRQKNNQNNNGGLKKVNSKVFITEKKIDSLDRSH